MTDHTQQKQDLLQGPHILGLESHCEVANGVLGPHHVLHPNLRVHDAAKRLHTFGQERCVVVSAVSRSVSIQTVDRESCESAAPPQRRSEQKGPTRI